MRLLVGIALAPFLTRIHARRWLSSILFLGLAGCAGLGPVAMWQLSQFDLLTADPESLSAALAVPDTIRLRDGDASLYLGYQVEGEDTPRVDEHFEMRIAREDKSAPDAQMGEAVYVVSLTPDVAERMRAAQKKILQLKDQEQDGRGTFSISFDSGCYSGVRPTVLPLRTFLRFTPDGPFIQMVSTENVLDDLDGETADTLISKLEPCS